MDPLDPMMAPLPAVRVNPVPRAFCVTGIDCFGPFEAKRGRGSHKVYGVIFTCLTCRAVHLK